MVVDIELGHLLGHVVVLVNAQNLRRRDKCQLAARFASSTSSLSCQAACMVGEQQEVQTCTFLWFRSAIGVKSSGCACVQQRLK